MNVLWIEDFGGGLSADSATLINLFRGLIDARVFDDAWSPEADLLSDPSELRRFFDTHSPRHRVDLVRHYGDFQALGSDDLNNRFDAVAIDINLSRGVPRQLAIPDTYSDAPAFHLKAGFYIYNQLIRQGFPAENMCFLTGEAGSTFRDFSEHCRQALMPLPIAHEKDDAGLEKFRDWLSKRQSPYTILRRGVIESCRSARERLGKDTEMIQFNAFLESGRTNVRAMDDYLSALETYLPARVPAPADLPRVLRMFVRTVAHEWESNAKPTNIRPQGDQSLKAIRAFGQVMKNTRNWLAHGDALNAMTTPVAAYLFMVNLRAMFKLLTETQGHEHILFPLFGQPLFAMNKQILEEQLAGTHAEALRLCQQHGGEPLIDQSYEKLVNQAENLGATNFDYLRALYLILWHQLAQRKNDNPQDYRCDCRPQVFKLSEHREDFLNLLMRHLINHSFPTDQLT